VEVRPRADREVEAEERQPDHEREEMQIREAPEEVADGAEEVGDVVAEGREGHAT
jgi:hypothetical protein